jgi:hypothetical protein
LAGQQQRAPLPVGSARGREGARWYNQRPSSEEIAAWFKDNVPMHEGMKPERYVGGLTLIPGKEYPEEAVAAGRRQTFLKKVVNQVFTPYCKVETRVQYFWDLMAMKDEWIGMIEPVEPMHDTGSRALPPGFFYANYKVEAKDVTFVCCTMRVRVIEREGAEWVDVPERWAGGRKVGGGRVLQGIPVIESPPATKMIPILTTTGYGQNARVSADPFMLMKAETGATGRALGLAGMLVVPGTGIATAEDMLEAASQGAPTAADGAADATLPEAPAAPEEAPSGSGEADARSPLEVLQAEVTEKVAKLAEDNPGAHEEFQRWAREDRGFKDLGSLNESQLRGVSRKLDRDLKAAVEPEPEPPASE